MCQDIALGSTSKDWLTQNQDNVSEHNIREYESKDWLTQNQDNVSGHSIREYELKQVDSESG